MEVSEPPSKKKKSDKLMSYDKFLKESAKEGEIYLPAELRIPTQPHPQVAAIRYRYTQSIASQQEADSVTADGQEHEFTDKYDIEC